MKDAGGTGAATAGWPWGPGSSRAATVTGPTGLRAQRALCTVQPHRGSCAAGAGVVSAALYITARCASARFAPFMTVPNEANPSWRARFVCLRATVRLSCAGLLAFAAGGRFPSAASLRVSAGPAMRVQPESVRAELRARRLAAVVSGRGGRAVQALDASG